jgi:hypothetical protein
MTRLFLYNNGPRGDAMFCRAVYRAVAAADRFDLVLGACRDDAALLVDLAGPRCRIAAAEFANTPHGALLDLAHLRPDGCQAIAVWLGGNEEHPSYQWPDVVESFDDDLRRLGLGFALAPLAADVPMLDFGGELARRAAPPPLRRPSIYLDNARGLFEPSHFVFDFERLADVLPGFDLLCTAGTPVRHDSLVDVTHLGPVGLQLLSNQCAALVGTTMDPFCLTLTETNRWKPKAMCGYDARVHGPAWDYPGNPVEMLATMDELVDFLLANVAEGSRR